MLALPSPALTGDIQGYWEPAVVPGCPFGHLVSVVCPTDPPAHVVAHLHPLERMYADLLDSAQRRREWVGGRICLAAALKSVLPDRQAFLAAPTGAPIIPAGWIGSVSHKGPLVLALTARALGGIGVDVERAECRDQDLEQKVLTPAERERLPADKDRATRAIVMHFSVKEAVYKALDEADQKELEFEDIETVLSAEISRIWSPVSVRLVGRQTVVRAALIFEGDWIVAAAKREPS